VGSGDPSRFSTNSTRLGPRVIIMPKGLGDFVKLVAVDIPDQRTVAKLQAVKRHVDFAREYNLVRMDQETELVEMLVAGAKFGAAIAELRARPDPD
jgi:hypothetical protein